MGLSFRSRDRTSMDADRETSALRDALAIAIVKQKKESAAEVLEWKERALKAESELCRLKASLEGTSSDDAFLRHLPQFKPIAKETAPTHTAVQDVTDRQSTLVAFLKNVHALRTSQVLAKEGKEEDLLNVSTSTLVSDFVKSTLPWLSPGKLRTAYAQHAAEYVLMQLSAEHRSEFLERNSRERAVELIESVLASLVEPPEERSEHGPVTDLTASIEFLLNLFESAECVMLVLRKSSQSILKVVQEMAQHALHLKENHDDLNVQQCELFLEEHAAACQSARHLFDLQERALEKMIELLYTSVDARSLSHDWIDEVVRSTMHVQQFVEILDIFLPDMAAMVYSSTALIIAALQRIGSEAGFPSDGAAHRTKCMQFSKSIRDFYMPLSWKKRT